jgi:hypothetical protein
MNKETLLRQIAECGYNVGFGAKKHFATYDMISKIPGIINFLSIAFGVLSLSFIELSSAKFLAALVLIMGVVGVYLSCYESEKGKYDELGVKLTNIFNDLKSLYFVVRDTESLDIEKSFQEFKNLESSYYKNTLTKQVLLSDWYAHYKFFWQHQIDWVDEQLKFNFWRDKVPLSFVITILTIAILCVFYFSDYFYESVRYLWLSISL